MILSKYDYFGRGFSILFIKSLTVLTSPALLARSVYSSAYRTKRMEQMEIQHVEIEGLPYQVLVHD
jgi:hypothetical protein